MKAIIFDFDGVIHDTFELAYGINVKYIDINLTREKYRSFFEGNIYAHRENKDADNKKYFKIQKEQFKKLKIDDDVRKCIEKLAKLYKLFIISSNAEESLNIYFYNNNLTQVFKEILGYESHKSKVEKFKHIFAKYGLNKNDCVFITDTLGDILEGHKVGVRTIAVDFGFHERERLEKGNPYKIVSNFEEIVKLINEN